MEYAYTIDELKALFIEKGEEITNKKGEKCYIFDNITADNYKTYPFHICYYRIIYSGKIGVGESYFNIRYNKTRDILEYDQVLQWLPINEDKHRFFIKDVDSIEKFKNEYKKLHKNEIKKSIKSELRILNRERKKYEKDMKICESKIDKLITIYNSI